MDNFEDILSIVLDIKYSKFIKKKSKFCNYNECQKEASYNYKNNKIRLYCKSHKLNNMINVGVKICIYKNCKVRATFNYENEKNPLYCVTHKLNNMFDVRSKRCLNKICRKQPFYNYENEKKALYCVEHKLDNMIDIKSKKCEFENCKKQPSYNYENKLNAKYCKLHKLENMIDIKHNKCIFKECKTRPHFNYKNELNAIYCKNHKLQNMINITSKTCIFDSCKVQSIFNYENKKNGIYCTIHKLENMIDVKNKKCLTNLCDVQIKKKYNGYCLRCFIHTFPDAKIIRDYGTREAKVTNFIKEEFKIISNKSIQGGCSQNRPDIFIDCLTHSVIIEIDEHQHKNKSYTPECEIQRINNLFTDLADRPIIFIRFNPDSYKNKKNKLIKGCFDVSELQELPKANKTLIPRLNKLKEEIEKNIKLIPNEHITIIKLYYDEN